MLGLSPEQHGGWIGIGDPGEPSTHKPRVSVTAGECAILSSLAAGRKVLEIGTGLGVSTRALARWARSVVTVDIDPWVAEKVVPTFADMPHVQFIANRHHELAGYEPEMVFIDADHSTTATTEDIEYALLLKPRLIAVHDANYDNVRAALQPLDAWLILDTAHGIAVRAL